jgi:hypothetical protein
MTKKNPPKKWFKWREHQARRYEKYDHPKEAQKYREATDKIATDFTNGKPEARQQIQDEIGYKPKNRTKAKTKP